MAAPSHEEPDCTAGDQESSASFHNVVWYPRRTLRLTDPAPLTPGMQPRRNPEGSVKPASSRR
jgi:hypothetical protein